MNFYHFTSSLQSLLDKEVIEITLPHPFRKVMAALYPQRHWDLKIMVEHTYVFIFIHLFLFCLFLCDGLKK